MGFQHENHFINLEQRRNREGSVHITWTSGSQSRGKSHLSHEEDTRALQLEIDHLKRKLRHELRKRTPSSSNSSSNGDKDGNYRRRSRTPPSKSFLYIENHHLECRNKSSFSKSEGNDAMSRALNQIFRSPFTHRIEEGVLSRRFT